MRIKKLRKHGLSELFCVIEHAFPIVGVCHIYMF